MPGCAGELRRAGCPDRLHPPSWLYRVHPIQLQRCRSDVHRACRHHDAELQGLGCGRRRLHLQYVRQRFGRRRLCDRQPRRYGWQQPDGGGRWRRIGCRTFGGCRQFSLRRWRRGRQRHRRHTARRRRRWWSQRDGAEWHREADCGWRWRRRGRSGVRHVSSRGSGWRDDRTGGQQLRTCRLRGCRRLRWAGRKLGLWRGWRRQRRNGSKRLGRHRETGRRRRQRRTFCVLHRKQRRWRWRWRLLRRWWRQRRL